VAGGACRGEGGGGRRRRRKRKEEEERGDRSVVKMMTRRVAGARVETCFLF
jgi:hypothetical protein